MRWYFLSSAIAASVLCVAQARAQVPAGTATPRGATHRSQPTPARTDRSGVHKPGKITGPALKSSIFVGGEIVDLPDRECGKKVSQALDKRAAVPVSDPLCADAMNRALELQKTHPESDDDDAPD